MTMMIKVAKCQYGGSFLGLVWDPRIILFNISTTIIDESANFESSKFNFGRFRSGFLEEWASKELTKFTR
jgi:hypothetical protein